MNVKFCNTMLLAVLLLLFKVNITANPLLEEHERFAFENATDEVLEERISHLYSHVDLRINYEAKRMIRDYTVKYPHSAEALLARVATYFPMIEGVLREYDVPEEIKYLAIVESSLKPTARSHHGALGLWQFVSATAKRYDLRQDSYVDERMDPVKSTRSAVEYLIDLHDMFGDWTLAMAAYNAGPGNVLKAQKRSGKKDYWSIKTFLPKETQKYIPRFVAANYIVNYYYAHNIVPKSPEVLLENTKSARIYENISFKEISNQLNLDIKLIKELNPEFKRNLIPKSDGRYLLTLPTDDMYRLLENNEYHMEINDDLNQLFTNYEEIEVAEVEERKVNDSIKNSPGTEFDYIIFEDVKQLKKILKERNDLTLQEIMEFNELDDKSLILPGTLLKLKKA